MASYQGDTFGRTPRIDADFSSSSCLFTPLSFLFWLEPQGTCQGSRSCEISKKVWEELEKKRRKVSSRGGQSEGGLITRNTWSSCYFSLYLYLPFDSNEWWTRRTVDQDRVENARRKRSWETVTKWTRKNLFVLLSPRKNGGTQKTENQDQENR